MLKKNTKMHLSEIRFLVAIGFVFGKNYIWLNLVYVNFAGLDSVQTGIDSHHDKCFSHGKTGTKTLAISPNPFYPSSTKSQLR